MEIPLRFIPTGDAHVIPTGGVMKILLSLFAIFLSVSFFPTLSFCDQYVIYFIEGHYEKTDSNPLDDKYCALVNVYVATPYAGSCGEKIAILKSDNSTTGAFELQLMGSVRGSTLPNPYWYYKDEDGKAVFIDGKLQQVFENFSKMKLKKIGLGGLRPLVDLFKDDKEWPIVSAGIYSFDVKDTSRWGGRYSRALKVNHGLFVPTVNNNPNQSYKRKANGIWIHRGRKNAPNRDSEGCLTIHPDSWDTFQLFFPSQNVWEDTASVGTVYVVRSNIATEICNSSSGAVHRINTPSVNGINAPQDLSIQ